MAITFQFQHPVILAGRRKLKQFLETQLAREDKMVGSISIIFCTDDFLLDINQRYLSHDTYTDIVTFDLSHSPHIIDAEIYISVDRLKENALKFGQTLNRELHRVIFHGVLHLAGYKDKTSAHQQEMRKMEDQYLHAYFN